METGNLMIDAQTAFSREQRRRRRARALGWLTRRSSGCLTSLEQVLGVDAPAVRRVTGLDAIPLDSIVGTAERAKTRTFDGRFRPGSSSRRRWEGLWMAGRRGATLPPISVYRLGDRHFVRDGHHRVSVARSLGMGAIDAEVTDLGAGS
jgi:ParB-like chromosome segregation protein Spo0J